MAVFLFMTASMVVLTGLMGLVAGSMARIMGGQQGPRPAEPAREHGSSSIGKASAQAHRRTEPLKQPVKNPNL
jgi:hypothetical protein